jgi:flotillin
VAKVQQGTKPADLAVEQTRAVNAALIAQAEAKRQEVMGVQREAELDATLLARAKADAERVKIDALARATAAATRLRAVAEATAGSIRLVNAAIHEGGDSYFRCRQIELLPDIAPVIADASAEATMVTIRGGERRRA